MDTDTTIGQLDLPEEMSLHARIVVERWLQLAYVAAQKNDAYEMHRLLGLARRKISDEMAKTRCGEED